MSESTLRPHGLRDDFADRIGRLTAEQLEEFASADVVIHLSRRVAQAKIYPAVDLRTSRSRLLETGGVAPSHTDVAAQVRRVLSGASWNAGEQREHSGDPLMLERARKLRGRDRGDSQSSPCG